MHLYVYILPLSILWPRLMCWWNLVKSMNNWILFIWCYIFTLFKNKSWIQNIYAMKRGWWWKNTKKIYEKAKRHRLFILLFGNHHACTKQEEKNAVLCIWIHKKHNILKCTQLKWRKKRERKIVDILLKCWLDKARAKWSRSNVLLPFSSFLLRLFCTKRLF